MCCVICVVWFFFFQAEDGIRDLVRSRGLGDVYKRQVDKWVKWGQFLALTFAGMLTTHAFIVGIGNLRTPVSYTHLTLPTSDLV